MKAWISGARRGRSAEIVPKPSLGTTTVLPCSSAASMASKASLMVWKMPFERQSASVKCEAGSSPQ
nr:hypothetical protein [uncultured Lichenicoccus sp.]